MFQAALMYLNFAGNFHPDLDPGILSHVGICHSFHVSTTALYLRSLDGVTVHLRERMNWFLVAADGVECCRVSRSLHGNDLSSIPYGSFKDMTSLTHL